MKVMKDDYTFLFPEKAQLILLVENENRELFLKCMQEYFTNKKKKYCEVFDEANNLIHPDEIEFLYFPYNQDYSNNYMLKTKSTLNTELTEYIIDNPEKFLSVDRIRENLKSLETDEGTYLMRKELSKGLTGSVEINFDNLDVANLLQMMEIDSSLLSDIEKCLVLYNLFLFEYRGRIKILYLDIPAKKEVFDWINNVIDDSTFIMLDNSQIQNDCLRYISECELIRLSNNDYLEEEEFAVQELSNYSYIFHPYISQNIALQTEKNIKLYKQFLDQTTTFCLTFSSYII